MDTFLAICQGIGLALAAGTIGGAFAGGAPQGRGGRSPLVIPLLLIAVVGGAVLFGASLSAEDQSSWPGWAAGALVAAFTFATVRAIVAGAIQRAPGQGSQAAIAGILAIVALVLVVLSLLPVSPIALVALVGLVYLAFARQRRAEEKYEGLRSLR